MQVSKQADPAGRQAGEEAGRQAGCKGCRSCSRSVASKGKAGARAGTDLPQDTKARHYTKSEACPKSTVSLRVTHSLSIEA